VQGDENVVHFKYMSLRLRGGFMLACNTSTVFVLIDR